MLLQRPLILASSSPRRQFLMKEVGFTFKVQKPVAEEDFPADMPVVEVARYLALKKAAYFRETITDEAVVTADTVVIINNRILNKPASREEAISMLSELAGHTHLVMTGVCIATATDVSAFEETTRVTFHAISASDIAYYVDHFKPFDKAGSYGAQDCLTPGINPCSAEEMTFLESIGRTALVRDSFTKTDTHGLAAIARIDGSYFNVMGLPIHKVYKALSRFQ